MGQHYVVDMKGNHTDLLFLNKCIYLFIWLLRELQNTDSLVVTCGLGSCGLGLVAPQHVGS